jgi:hypothetical protein
VGSSEAVELWLRPWTVGCNEATAISEYSMNDRLIPLADALREQAEKVDDPSIVAVLLFAAIEIERL